MASGEKVRVLIVDDVADTRENVRKLLQFESDIDVVGAARSAMEGIQLSQELDPDVVLMDINMPETDGIAASEAITSQAPSVQVVMMSVQGEADYLRRSMLAGAREFLIKPFTSEELTTSIRRVYQLASARRAYAPPVAPPTLEQASTTSKKPAGAKVVAIYSPKGGTGVTTIAVNLAVALHDETQQRVALVDASLQFGDVGLLMNLPTHRSIADVVDSKSELDEELLLGVMAGHSSGAKGNKLAAYAASGVSSCHESISLREAMERLRDAECCGTVNSREDAREFLRKNLLTKPAPMR